MTDLLKSYKSLQLKVLIISSMVALTNPGLLSAQQKNYHLEKVYPIDSLTTLYLTSNHAKVFITGTERTDVHLNISRNFEKNLALNKGAFAIDVTSEYGNLSIIEKSEESITATLGDEYKISLEIPYGISLYIKGKGGNYQINNINGSIEMDIDDADAEFTKCTSRYFKLNFKDGDIKMDKGAGDLNVSADDGDIVIENGAFEYINADIEDGAMVIRTDLTSGGKYYFDIDDGHLSLTIPQGGGDFHIDHDSESHINTTQNFKTISREEREIRIALRRSNAKVSIKADDSTIKLFDR